MSGIVASRGMQREAFDTWQKDLLMAELGA